MTHQRDVPRRKRVLWFDVIIFYFLVVVAWLRLDIAVVADSPMSAWDKLSLPAVEFYTLSNDPCDSRTILAGSWGQGVYRSSDGGAEWQACNQGLSNPRVRALVIDGEGTAYVGTYGNGVYRLSAGEQARCCS